MPRLLPAFPYAGEREGHVGSLDAQLKETSQRIRLFVKTLGIVYIELNKPWLCSFRRFWVTNVVFIVLLEGGPGVRKQICLYRGGL